MPEAKPPPTDRVFFKEGKQSERTVTKPYQGFRLYCHCGFSQTIFYLIAQSGCLASLGATWQRCKQPHLRFGQRRDPGSGADREGCCCGQSAPSSSRPRPQRSEATAPGRPQSGPGPLAPRSPAPLTRRRSLSAPGHVTRPSRPGPQRPVARAAAQRRLPRPPRPETPPPPPPHAAHSLSREQSHLSRERPRGRARAKGTRAGVRKKPSHVLWRAKLWGCHVMPRHPFYWPGSPARGSF